MSVELLEAARSGNLYKIQSLLGMGADIHFRNKELDTALHIATLNGSREVVDFLIGRGAAVDARNAYQETPLHKAVVRGNWQIIHKLIEAGAQLEVRNHLGYTPLHTAVLTGRSNDVTYALIESGSDIHTRSDTGESLLHTAAGEGLIEMVEYLLDRGLLPDIQDNEGNRPLHVVAARKNTLKRDTMQIVTILLDKGGNIHATNLRQQTALHCATFSGELATVALLCERGGSFQAKDVRGWLPVHIALGANALDIEEYLLSQGVEQDTPVTVEGEAAEVATDILLRAVFAESREQNMLLKEVLDTLYSRREFQPIIEVAALHAMGTRRQHKALRLFLADGKDITSVSVKGGASAYFPDSHVMVISTDHPFKKLVSIVAYELTRHAAQFVFRNSLLPYPSTDLILEKIYKAAIDQDTRASYLSLGIEEKEIQRLVISRTFVYSKALQKLPEYNAGIAQAVALFGRQPLTSFCPALFSYFDTQFLPACQHVRELHPLAALLRPVPEVMRQGAGVMAFPLQEISREAINPTVIVERLFLAVLSKLGKQKNVDTPPSALLTGYILDKAVKTELSKSLGRLEKLLGRYLNISALPETITADDFRKLIKALAELYTNGISNILLSPTRKVLKEVITQWQVGFLRLGPNPVARSGLFGRLTGYYLPGKRRIQVAEPSSLANLLDSVNHVAPDGPPSQSKNKEEASVL